MAAARVFGWVVLATIATPSASLAARSGLERHSNPHALVPTATDSADDWPHLRISHRPTDAPDLGSWRDLRRDVGTATCGFFPEFGMFMSAPAYLSRRKPTKLRPCLGDPYDCGPSRTCTTSGHYRRCC